MKTTILSQFKESYKILLLVAGIAIFIQYSSIIPIDFFESLILPNMAMTFLPLAVAIFSFVISKLYGFSKVFGRSYFIFGLSYVFFFAGEALFYFYMDVYGDYSVEFVSSWMFAISMTLLLFHIVINIRYFSEKLERYQQIILVVIPLVTFFGFFSVLEFNSDNFDKTILNLFFILYSSISLSLIIVAFTVFRYTILFGPWFLLLIGILLSTTGDFSFRYVDIVSTFSYTDLSVGLWLASSMVMIYALYKHQKSI